MAVKKILGAVDTAFREPMLAHTLDLSKGFPPGEWVAEEKLDGHRLIVSVKHQDNTALVTAWSRLGNERKLRPQILEALQYLEEGTYDGELIVPGGTSQHVKELANEHKTVLVLFDLLVLRGVDWTVNPYVDRRLDLERGFRRAIMHQDAAAPVRLALPMPCTSSEVVERYAEEIWEGGGEGLILKDINATYRCGKRSKAFLKYKETKSAVLQVLGYVESEGEKDYQGLYGSAVVSDGEFATVVKTLDDATRADLEKRFGKGIKPVYQEMRLSSGKKVQMLVNHPDVAGDRKLRIDYQQRTPDGNYRHPRWDRWEDE